MKRRAQSGEGEEKAEMLPREVMGRLHGPRKAESVKRRAETGYVGYQVSGEEFKLECTKFDKLLLVFRDGADKVTELPEKLFAGQELCCCGLPERERVFMRTATPATPTSAIPFFQGHVLRTCCTTQPDSY